MKIKKIFLLILTLGILALGIRLFDYYFRQSNRQYMHWRFYNGSPITQSAMVLDVMIKSKDHEVDRLNQFLVNQVDWAAFTKAASMATYNSSRGDNRYMPFITNIIMSSSVDYARRKHMLSMIIAHGITNDYDVIAKIASRTNDILSSDAESILEYYKVDRSKNYSSKENAEK